jgi:hypothetical protein
MANINNTFPNLTRVLNEYGQNLVDNYKSALAAETINASGELSKSIKYIFDDKTKGRFEIKLELLEYWKWVENGRRAGKMPPLKAIEKWIEVKPIIPRPMVNGKLPTQKQLAYLIARKIGLDGTKGRGILQDRIDNINMVFISDIENALMKDLGIQLEMIFKEVGF